MNARRLVILDPAMRQRAGHYFEYNMALKRAGEILGWSVHIYAHRDWHDRTDPSIIPVYSSSLGNSNSLKIIGHKIISILPSLVRKKVYKLFRNIYNLFFNKKSFDGTLTTKTIFGDESASIIKNTRNDDVILAPSISYLQMVDLLARWPQQNWRFVARHLPQNPMEKAALESLLSSFNGMPTHWLLCDTADLFDHLKNSGIQSTLIPIPMSPPEFTSKYKAAMPINGKFTFAVFGPPRIEKGFLHLPKLIDEIGDKAHFIVQITALKNIAFEPEIETTIDVLKSKYSKYITFLAEDMSEEEFYNAIIESSCLLLPYDAKRYEARASGLLVQSYLCGRPAIVPAGTWMADQVPDELSHTIWRDDLAATCRAVMDKNVDMSDFVTRWRQTHSAEGAFKAIIADGPNS